MSAKKRLIYYLTLALFFGALYGWYDFASVHSMDDSSVFRKWTMPHAMHIVKTWREGHVEFLRDGHFFPMWGAGIFLAATDLGFLENRSHLCFRAAIIFFLVASVLLGASVLRHRFGDRALWFAPLLGLNPIYFQLIGGVYDQFLFAAMICLASLMLVKTELSERHKWHWTVLGSLLFGLAANVRSDLTYTFLLYLVLRLRRADRSRMLQLAASGLIFVACLAPWMIAYYRASGLIGMTSANAGQVAYISLGESGRGNPWLVRSSDGWDGHEVGRRAREMRPEHKLAGVFSDPLANKAYFQMFVYKVTKHPYAYFRRTLNKLHAVLFSISPRVYSAPDPDGQAPAKALAVAMYRIMRPFHRFALWLLFCTGFAFVVRGMKHPLLDIGGFFVLVTIALASLFQFIDRHLFAFAACQGVALLALAGFLVRGIGAIRTRMTTGELLVNPKSGAMWRTVALYAPPLAMLVFIYRPNAFLGEFDIHSRLTGRAKIWEVRNYRKTNGALWNRAGNVIMSTKGVWVRLAEMNYRKPIEVSLNNVCDYMMTIYREDEDGSRKKVGEVRLEKDPMVRAGLANHFVPMPEPARTVGSNLVHIQPLGPAGGQYSMGHLTFRNNPRIHRRVATYDELPRGPVADGEQWNLRSHVVFYYHGLRIDLGATSHARAIEMSLDGNDIYEVDFLKASADGKKFEPVGRASIGPSDHVKTGMANYRLNVPDVVATKGYDRLELTPREGDGRFSLGHIRILNESK